MIKIIIIGLLCYTSVIATDYVLKMNDKSFTVSTEKTNMIRINNKTYKIKLIKKNIQKYISEYVSFNYLSNIQPSKQKLSAEISQIMMMTPLGSAVLIQEYKLGNIPKDLMFKTMKKELSSSYNSQNYIISKNESITKELKNGLKLTGIKYIIKNKLTGKNENITKLYLMSSSDKSLFIATSFNLIDEVEDKNIKDVLEIFWDTLNINL